MSPSSTFSCITFALVVATACGSDDSDDSVSFGGGGSGGGLGGAAGTSGSGGASGGSAGGSSGNAGAASGGTSATGGGAGAGTGGTAAGGSGGTCTSGTGGSGPCGSDGTSWPASSQKLECDLVELLNQKRATGVKCGTTDMGSAPALSRNQVLTQNARDHSQDMHDNGYVDLIEKDGTSPGDWSMQGYCGKFVAAEVGAGHSSASTFLATLLNVETECIKLMQPGAKGIGVGYVTDATGQSVHLWTLIIGNAP